MAPTRKKASKNRSQREKEEVIRARQYYDGLGAKNQVQSFNPRSKKKVSKKPPPNDSKAKLKQRAEAIKLKKEMERYNAQQRAKGEQLKTAIVKKPIPTSKALTIKKKRTTKHKIDGRKSKAERKAIATRKKEFERERAKQWASDDKDKNKYNAHESDLDEEESSEESEVEEDSEMENESELDTESEEEEEPMIQQVAPAPTPRYNPVEVPHDPYTYSYGPTVVAYQPIYQEPVAYHQPLEPAGVAMGDYFPVQAPNASTRRQQPLRPSRTVQEQIIQDECLEEAEDLEPDTLYSTHEQPQRCRWNPCSCRMFFSFLSIFGFAAMAIFAPKTQSIVPGYAPATAAPSGTRFEDSMFNSFPERSPTPAYYLERNNSFHRPENHFGGELSLNPKHTSKDNARSESRPHHKLPAEKDSLLDSDITHTKQIFDLPVCKDSLIVEWLGHGSPTFDSNVNLPHIGIAESLRFDELMVAISAFQNTMVTTRPPNDLVAIGMSPDVELWQEPSVNGMGMFRGVYELCLHGDSRRFAIQLWQMQVAVYGR